mgnify:CR=1 FL=1
MEKSIQCIKIVIIYHIEAERNPTGDIVGRTPDNEERWKIK